MIDSVSLEINRMILADTIAAISTAAGTGAIAIVRLSGPSAWAIAKEIFVVGNTKNAPTLKSHHALHGYLRSAGNGQTLVDEVVLVPYQSPNSFTGEDLVEINCHGGQVVTNEVLCLCLSGGARLAAAGEFTQRAFLNGRIDLTQAEAVLDVIQAKTGLQSRLAISALKGDLGHKITDVRTRLVELLSRIVAGIDFPEEVGDMPLTDLEEILAGCMLDLQNLSKTARSGRYLRDGIKVAIAGKPNAGKSSLLNQLLQFDRAIVTDIAGTTRDSLEEELDVNGIPLILIDTAGIRSTHDQVEVLGIERTKQSIDKADLVLLVTDVVSGWNEDDVLVGELVKIRPHIILANKVDLSSQFEFNGKGHDTASFGSADIPPAYCTNEACLAKIAISAKTGAGIGTLTDTIERWVFNDPAAKNCGGTLNQRQAELCQRALDSLILVQETAANMMPQDCLATDLKLAVDNLYEISGEKVSEEIISNVFARFCIGK